MSTRRSILPSVQVRLWSGPHPPAHGHQVQYHYMAKAKSAVYESRPSGTGRPLALGRRQRHRQAEGTRAVHPATQQPSRGPRSGNRRASFTYFCPVLQRVDVVAGLLVPPPVTSQQVNKLAGVVLGGVPPAHTPVGGSAVCWRVVSRELFGPSKKIGPQARRVVGTRCALSSVPVPAAPAAVMGVTVRAGTGGGRGAFEEVTDPALERGVARNDCEWRRAGSPVAPAPEPEKP